MTEAMSLPEALDRYKAARQHVHDALDARDPARLAAAIQVETMWERIVDRKRLQADMHTRLATGTVIQHQFTTGYSLRPLSLDAPRSMARIDNIGTS